MKQIIIRAERLALDAKAILSLIEKSDTSVQKITQAIAKLMYRYAILRIDLINSIKRD